MLSHWGQKTRKEGSFLVSIQYCTGDSNQWSAVREETKGTQIGKEEVKLFLLTWLLYRKSNGITATKAFRTTEFNQAQ